MAATRRPWRAHRHRAAERWQPARRALVSRGPGRTAALWALAAGHLAEAARLRRRAGGLAALPAGTDHPVPVDGVTVIGRPVDPATLAGVAAELATRPIDVVDLVPGDLPAARALRLLRRIDPRRVENDPLHTPGGAHERLAVRTTLAARMDVETAGSHEPYDRGRAVRQTVRAQRYAPTSAAYRVIARRH